MRAPSEPSTGYSLQPRLRVFAGRQLVLGRGKIMLLRCIRETGSISEAARRMGISYAHAWMLLRTMNGSFRRPLVITNRGGKSQGGAKLTETGGLVLEIYADMIAGSERATRKSWQHLQNLLRPAADLPALTSRDLQTESDPPNL